MASITATIAPIEPTLEDLPPRQGEPLSVVVVGAGTAGLTAAYQLRQAGHMPTILEARNRPGGRVHTIRAPFSDGQTAEAGAFFMPLDHEYLMKYLRLTGLDRELVPISPEQLGGSLFMAGQRLLLDLDGPKTWPDDLTNTDAIQRVPWPGDLTEAEQALGPEGLAQRYVAEEDGVGDFLSPDWPPPALRDYDRMTVEELAQSKGASPAAAELIRVLTFGGWGDSGRGLSALHGLQQYEDIRSLQSTTSWCTLAGGNDRWHFRLAEILRDYIAYGTEVVAIRHDEDGVRVTARRNGRDSTIDADHVICALPYACLREVQFTPELPAEKRHAVDHLRSTSVGHLFLQCRHRIWRAGARGLFAFGFADLPIASAIRDATFNQPGPRGILNLYMTGPAVDAISALTSDERLAHVLPYLERLFPGLEAEIEGIAWHSWSSDPWSRGDYVYYAPGEFNDIWPHVATPTGRIHFAGDHTSAISSWQEGAILSAHRCAREVHEAVRPVT